MNTHTPSSRTLREWLQLLVERESTPTTQTLSSLQPALADALPRRLPSDPAPISGPIPAPVSLDENAAASTVRIATSHPEEVPPDLPETVSARSEPPAARTAFTDSANVSPEGTVQPHGEWSARAATLPALNALFADLLPAAAVGPKTMPAEPIAVRYSSSWLPPVADATPPARANPAQLRTETPDRPPTISRAAHWQRPGALSLTDITPFSQPLDPPEATGEAVAGDPWSETRGETWQAFEPTDNDDALRAELASLARRLADLESAHGAG